MSDLSWVLTQLESQFFERKSCYDRSSGQPRLRPARDVARNIAETLVAMANADGGTVVIGIEDDGTVSGADYGDDRLQVLRDAPRTHVIPPLRPRLHEGTLQGKRIVLFEVDWSMQVHQLSDGRYLYRFNDQNQPFPASDIEAMKQGRRRRLVEAQFVTEATLADLDLSLVAALAERQRIPDRPEEVLARYRLVEGRNGGSAVTLAALLLFGSDSARWHPRSGIDFTRYEGTQRHVGAELNVVKRDRVEGPLVLLIRKAYETVRPHLRERQRLVDLFFEERLEYPAFAWQEAIVNAVAHRDYGYSGSGVEVQLYDDRLEVRSPGQLVEPVTLDRLAKRESIHASRNPRIVRVLADYGYMREQGEGIPRMYAAMEHEGLYPPAFRLDADVVFVVTLRNTVAFRPETLQWLSGLSDVALSGNQKRVLAYGMERGGSFTSRDYQRLVGADIYTASREIKDLIRKGLVLLPKKGGRVYEVVRSRSDRPENDKPSEFVVIEKAFIAKGWVTNQDIREALGVSRRQAFRIATNLVDLGWMRAEGNRRGRRYVLLARPGR